MTTDSVITLSADASGVERGIGQAERSLNSLAQTANRAGGQAAGSLNNVGDAAEKAAQKQAKASRSIELALQREIALLQAGERGSRQYYESLAQQRGVDTARLTPMLNQLDNLRQKTDGLTISQGQYNAALRTMPAQMTDIVTQLAGGQSPFLIAIQQGGQMRDSFGGFGNMFKGIAASISPFKLAMGGAVGAIGAVGYAMYAGAKEGREFQNVLTLSGDRAGITASELQKVAGIVGETTGSFSAGRAAVMAFAAEGKIARDDYADFATSVSLMSQATGKDVADLVGEFAKIGDDPVKAVVDLSGKYKSMTADVYAQVTALKEQGKEQEAVRLVQKLYADETAEMARQVTENLGWIERGWKNISESASEAWESLKSIGKTQTIEQQIAKLEAENANLSRMEAEFGADTSKERAANQAKLRMLKQEQRVEEELTDAKRAKQLVNENAVKSMDNLRRGAENALPAIAKLRQELNKIDDDLANVRASGDKKAIADAEKWAKAKKAKVHQDIEAEQNRERKAAERENRVATRGLLPTTADGLRKTATAESYVGGKKRFVHGGTYAAAHSMQRMLGSDLTYFTAFNDAYHHSERYFRKKGNRSSGTHGAGLAFDFGLKGGKRVAAVATRRINAHLQNLGFREGIDYTLLDEYNKPSKGATGGHMHFNWKSAAAAARFAQSDTAKAMSKSSIYGGSLEKAARAEIPKKTDFEKYIEQAQAKQLRDDVERRLRANGKHRVIENELALTSRPEFAKWTKEQQNSELAKARAADEIATNEKISAMASEQLAKMQQKHDLIGKTGELVRLQYETQSGSLKHLSDAQKNAILDEQFRIDLATRQYETNKKYSDLIVQQSQKTHEKLANAEIEIALMGKSKSEIERLTLAREYDLHIMQAAADGAGVQYIEMLRENARAAEETRQKIAEMQAVAKGQVWGENGKPMFQAALNGATEAMGGFFDTYSNLHAQIENWTTQSFERMGSSLADFVATGKADFREMAQSMIADLSRVMVKAAFVHTLQAGVGAMAGGGGWVGSVGGMLKGALGWAEGGYTGHGGKFEPAGIVHRGEYVLSQENLRALGGVSAVENLLHRAKGYSSGGLVGGGVGILAHAKAAQSAAPTINITVNVSGSNREEARQGAEEGVTAALQAAMQQIANMQIAENLRPNGMIFNLVKG